MNTTETKTATGSPPEVELVSKKDKDVSSPETSPGDAWDEKAEAQRKWAKGKQKRTVSSESSTRGVTPPDTPNDGDDDEMIAEPPSQEAAPPTEDYGDLASRRYKPTRQSVDTTYSTNHQDDSPDPEAEDRTPNQISVDLTRSHKASSNYGHVEANGWSKVTLGNVFHDAMYRPPEMQQNFGSIRFASNSTGIFGNVNHYYSPALLGGLQVLNANEDKEDTVLRKRSRIANQSNTSLPTMPIAYLPHVPVSKSDLRRALVKIAVVCQTLDTAFSEYFRTVISGLGSTEKILQNLREQILSRQPGSLKYVGPFGEYCESINKVRLSERPQRLVQYQDRATGDDIQPYLQDALEVPYWSMMADQFIRSSHINNPLTYDAVLSVINDKRRELNLRLRQARETWPDDLPQAIIEGISRRISVLDDLLAQTSDRYESLEEQQVQALQRSPTSGLDASIVLANSVSTKPLSATVTVSDTAEVTDLEKVSLLSLLLIFTALSMIPFGMGFAGDWVVESSNAIGSAADPDFKWLIATTLLSILGNIYAVVPLRKITRGSAAGIVSQILLYLSIILGCFSVAAYPFWNKAWSSSLSFFCSYFAIGSVCVSTQRTSDTAEGTSGGSSKAKRD